MKKIQSLLILISLFLAATSYAQEVVYKDTTYTVKRKSIYLSKIDVTKTLKPEKVNEIFAIHKINEDKIDAIKKTAKEKKASEKKLKKAEKALKNKVKAQKKLSKANDNLKSGIKKFNKLKKKGDLSPNDNQKWLEKIEKLKKKVAKAEKNFKKS
ncbi:glycine--tRNA ligase subunit alpha [Polaribacter sp. NJDZ03]|uniref:glycine--tRNA ligase subunit alpha n=1 Tax=Polaribacter sp. NJDZ03 TaxID=2855841 RepID=UPI001C4A557C|nr:glycine--tRNA ligase subunit alpha [Polaribacter sp. NJDZ03]